MKMLHLNVAALAFLLLANYPQITAGSASLGRQKRQDKAVAVLSQKIRKDVTNRHNHWRREAGASDMHFMMYSTELEQDAQHWANQCNFYHGGKPNAGQNIWIGTYPPEVIDWVGVVDSWHSEITDYNYDKMTCTDGKKCGHYTAVVWHNTILVGCGFNWCPGPGFIDKRPDGSSKAFRGKAGSVVVCNYRPGQGYPYAGQPFSAQPFKKGAACSQCPKDSSKCDKKLCVQGADQCDQAPRCVGDAKRDPESCLCECTNKSPMPYCEQDEAAAATVGPTGEKTNTDIAADKPKVKGSIKFTTKAWSDDLSDTQSSAFKKESNSFCNAITEELPDAGGCKVTAFRKGSVIVDFEVWPATDSSPAALLTTMTEALSGSKSKLFPGETLEDFNAVVSGDNTVSLLAVAAVAVGVVALLLLAAGGVLVYVVYRRRPKDAAGAANSPARQP